MYGVSSMSSKTECISFYSDKDKNIKYNIIIEISSSSKEPL